MEVGSIFKMAWASDNCPPFRLVNLHKEMEKEGLRVIHEGPMVNTVMSVALMMQPV